MQGDIHQIQNKFTPHLEGINYTTHHMNLAMQTLSHIRIIKCIVWSLYFNPFTHFFVIIQDFALYLFISPSLFFYLSLFLFFVCLFLCLYSSWLNFATAIILHTRVICSNVCNNCCCVAYVFGATKTSALLNVEKILTSSKPTLKTLKDFV